MTALCGGGPSQAKPGYASTLIAGIQTFADLLSNAPAKWAIPLTFGLSAISYDLNTLCATDPPAMPVFTVADMINLALPLSDPIGTIASVGKLHDLIKIYAWYQYCQCTAVATPAPPVAPPAPAGAPQINPPGGLPTGSTSGCYAGDYSGTPYQYATAGGPPFPDQYNSNQLTPGWPAGPNEVTAGPSTNHTVILPSPNPLQVRLDASVQFQPGATQSAWVSFKAWTAAGGNLGQLGFQFLRANGLSQSQSLLVSIPATAQYVQVAAVELDQPVSSQMHVTTTWFCAGAGSGAISAPCPPDPIVAGMLEQILAMVTLIQRQAVPFSYIHGASHPGLTGAGHFAVQGLLGCKVQLTAMPGYLGQDGVLPVELFDVGFITWSDPDGYPGSHRIEHNPYLSLPARCSIYTDLAYDLHPGVVATITEIVREA